MKSFLLAILSLFGLGGCGKKEGGASDGADSEPSKALPVIEIDESLWSFPVVDLRPVTLTMIAASTDQKMAENSVSYGSEDGSSFWGVVPDGETFTRESPLVYPVAGGWLGDGVLFAPTSMDEKWAIFYRDGKILLVRSWQRRVVAVADVEIAGNEAVVSKIRGDLGGEDIWSDFDFLMRSYAMDEVYPCTVESIESPTEALGLIYFSQFGNRAHFAAKGPLPFIPFPTNASLRTNSLLHIAVATGDIESVRSLVDGGAPVDALARDGLATLHWALARTDPDFRVQRLLIDAGCPVDVRSTQGATPLMNAVQSKELSQAKFLLKNGADAGAKDGRGFTSLHRAAEMGLPEFVELLVANGADPKAEAEGHTPLTLAEGGKHAAIVDLLRGKE